MGSIGASCFHTLSDDTRDLSKEEWDAIRFGQVCTQAENFADWKAAILKFCKYTRICTYEEKRLLRAFVKRIEEQRLAADVLRGALR